jgi:hypothetical protein
MGGVTAEMFFVLSILIGFCLGFCLSRACICGSSKGCCSKKCSDKKGSCGTDK